MHLIIIGIAAFFAVAVTLAILILATQESAKKKALKILAGEKATNKEILRTIDILSASQDTEAPDLCRRLRLMADMTKPGEKAPMGFKG